MTPKLALGLIAGLTAADTAVATPRTVYLEDAEGARIAIADLDFAGPAYSVAMRPEPFTDHFLSMRPFKCLEGPEKHWCHVPYPYEIARDVSDGLTDLEYDFLFIWKGATEYGINMWNGVYYQLSEAEDGSLTGTLHEMNMDDLAVPPAPGDMRPIGDRDLEEGDPDSHWLPYLVIE